MLPHPGGSPEEIQCAQRLGKGENVPLERENGGSRWSAACWPGRGDWSGWLDYFSVMSKFERSETASGKANMVLWNLFVSALMK